MASVRRLKVVKLTWELYLLMFIVRAAYCFILDYYLYIYFFI